MFNHAAAIGIDIGHFLIKIAVVKIDGEIIAVKSYPLDQKQTRVYIIEKIVEAIGYIRKQVAGEGINISGVKSSAFVNTLENCRSELRIERAQLGAAGSLLGSAYWSMTSLAGKSI